MDRRGWRTVLGVVLLVNLFIGMAQQVLGCKGKYVIELETGNVFNAGGDMPVVSVHFGNGWEDAKGFPQCLDPASKARSIQYEEQPLRLNLAMERPNFVCLKYLTVYSLNENCENDEVISRVSLAEVSGVEGAFAQQFGQTFLTFPPGQCFWMGPMVGGIRRLKTSKNGEIKTICAHSGALFNPDVVQCIGNLPNEPWFDAEWPLSVDAVFDCGMP